MFFRLLTAATQTPGSVCPQQDCCSGWWGCHIAVKYSLLWVHCFTSGHSRLLDLVGESLPTSSLCVSCIIFCQLITKPPRNLIQYWMMPLPWVYRALLLNEFTSDKYAEGDPSEGEKILASWGFMYKGEPFTREWIGYCFAYLIPFVSTINLKHSTAP